MHFFKDIISQSLRLISTEPKAFVSYLEILLDKNINGNIIAKHYDKRDDFIFSIVNFPYIFSNIP